MPFIGKWRLNLGKSKLTGQTIDIDEISPDHYKFKEDEHSDVIFADGLDHVTHFGDSMAITKKSADTWGITYKRDETVLMDTVWKISPDGKTLTYTAIGSRPNGQHFKNQMTLRRTSGTSGIAGNWETTDAELSSPRDIFIAPYSTGGHVITYDGKEYADDGPTVPADSTSSGRRIDERTIENTEKNTEKIKGRLIETAKATISADGATQTIVVTEPGDPTAVILVYAREPEAR